MVVEEVDPENNSTNPTTSLENGPTKRLGCCYRACYNKYQCAIRNGRSQTIFLGLFEDVETAARLYDCAAILLRGSDTQTNYPPSTYRQAELQKMVQMLASKGVKVKLPSKLPQKSPKRADSMSHGKESQKDIHPPGMEATDGADCTAAAAGASPHKQTQQDSPHDGLWMRKWRQEASYQPRAKAAPACHEQSLPEGPRNRPRGQGPVLSGKRTWQEDAAGQAQEAPFGPPKRMKQDDGVGKELRARGDKRTWPMHATRSSQHSSGSQAHSPRVPHLAQDPHPGLPPRPTRPHPRAGGLPPVVPSSHTHRPSAAARSPRNGQCSGGGGHGGLGYHLVAARNKYLAQICLGGRNINLGCFSDPKEAAMMYDCSALLLRGTGAHTNRPPSCYTAQDLNRIAQQLLAKGLKLCPAGLDLLQKHPGSTVQGKGIRPESSRGECSEPGAAVSGAHAHTSSEHTAAPPSGPRTVAPQNPTAETLRPGSKTTTATQKLSSGTGRVAEGIPQEHVNLARPAQAGRLRDAPQDQINLARRGQSGRLRDEPQEQISQTWCTQSGKLQDAPQEHIDSALRMRKLSSPPREQTTRHDRRAANGGQPLEILSDMEVDPQPTPTKLPWWRRRTTTKWPPGYIPWEHPPDPPPPPSAPLIQRVAAAAHVFMLEAAKKHVVPNRPAGGNLLGKPTSLPQLPDILAGGLAGRNGTYTEGAAPDWLLSYQLTQALGSVAKAVGAAVPSVVLAVSSLFRENRWDTVPVLYAGLQEACSRGDAAAARQLLQDLIDLAAAAAAAAAPAATAGAE